jgi:hypothetical protein
VVNRNPKQRGGAWIPSEHHKKSLKDEVLDSLAEAIKFASHPKSLREVILGKDDPHLLYGIVGNSYVESSTT